MQWLYEAFYSAIGELFADINDTVEDNTGRKWKVVSDASIKCQSRGERTASRLYAVEMVTPICKYEDIETIQQLVRELRRGGARVNDSCGIYIHVDASRHDPKTLRNIVNIMASKEDLRYKALNVQIDRECYCQKADLRFLEDVNLKHPKSMAEFETLWYNGDSRRNVHYDYSRYHALNLHSVFSKGTVEFRMFNSTLHAGEVKSYIQLCLAISHQALVQQRAMRTRTHSENEKYTFLNWGIRFEKPLEIPDRGSRPVHYAGKAELEQAILSECPLVYSGEPLPPQATLKPVAMPEKTALKT